MTSPDLDRTRVAWRTSSRTNSGSGNCVEAGPVDDGTGRVALRHSHHPEAAAFVSTRTTWKTLITDIKTGSYDF